MAVTSQDVTMRGLAEPLHGMIVVHISDMHAGFGNTDVVFEEALRRIDAIKPDLLLFTGDYVDDHATTKSYPAADLLRRFRARLGVFGSFGNHEHRRGIVGARRILDHAGIHVLNNESICLPGGLVLAGVDDLGEGKPDLKRALEDAPPDRTAILLSHHPKAIESLSDHDLFVLSGHTHGGQIDLPLFTPRMVCWLHLRCSQVAGWYANGKARLYVNRGMGVTGRPFRYRCPAELAVFRLVSEKPIK